MDFILPPVGIRTQDSSLIIIWALKTQGLMISTPSINVFIISIVNN